MKNFKLFPLLATLSLILFLGFSLNAQEEKKEEKKGDLFLVDVEYVTPEHYDEYVEWGREFKKLADETGFENFFVGSNMESFYYVWNIGSETSGLDEFGEKWEVWAKANPKVDEMYEKYKHTMTHRTRELWRIDKKHSYRPEGYKSTRDNTYTRMFFGYVKPGEGKAVAGLLDEYKAEWEDKKITNPYTVYWNVFGVETPCMLVVSSFKNREAWLADRKEVKEKVGKEKLEAWDNRWNTALRKMETKESFPRYDLSHFNEPALAPSEAASSGGN